jgi:lipopolysaccharide/colanic/teichoic acid biosynthesis glycosyltransferase
VSYPGFKYNMTDMNAAIGLVQMDRLPDLQAERRSLVERYFSSLAGVEEVELPACRPYVDHAWHLFIARVRPERLRVGRDEVIRMLNEAGIGTSVHFIPLHEHSYYRDVVGCRAEDVPVADENWRRIISLPLFPGMHQADVDRSLTLAEILKANRREAPMLKDSSISWLPPSASYPPPIPPGGGDPHQGRQHRPIFSQRREGVGGRRSAFSSSVRWSRAPTDGFAPDDWHPRVTRVGQILLVQDRRAAAAHNVVKGDMSLIGPRPEDPYSSALLVELKKGATVRPGMVGPSQILGRDELESYPEGLKDTETYYVQHVLPEKSDRDLEYVATASFLATWSYWRAGWATARRVKTKSSGGGAIASPCSASTPCWS